MARKRRDYKAEYAAAKRRAQSAGYTSQREYKRARKTLGVTGRRRTPPKRVLDRVLNSRDAAAQRWSDRHSLVIESRFDPTWPEARRQRYYDVFVVGGDRSRDTWLAKLRNLLVPDFYTDAEFDERYGIHNN